MKILEMPHMQRPNRDARFPVSIEGATLSLTVGQIADMLSAPALLNFGGVVSIDDPTLIALGDTVSFGHVVYDTESDALYYRTGLGNSVVYYTQWSGKDAYHNEDGDIRIDCLFVNGETTYRYDGTRMVQLNQITSEIAAAIEAKADRADLDQLRLAVDSKFDKSKVDRTSISDDCFAVPSSQVVLGTFRAFGEAMALKSDVVQVTGNGEGKVMSQAAVSRELRSLRDTTDDLESGLESLSEAKADRADLDQLRRSLPGTYVSRTEVSHSLNDDSTTNVASAWSVNAAMNAMGTISTQLSDRISTLEGRHVALTEAEYEALAEKDDDIIYLIYEDDTV